MNLNELDAWLAERNLGGHWSRHGDQGVVRPFLWKWSDIYQGLMWANELVPMEKTGRRTITLKNPGLKVGMTPTIHMWSNAYCRAKSHPLIGTTSPPSVSFSRAQKKPIPLSKASSCRCK